MSRSVYSEGHGKTSGLNVFNIAKKAAASFVVMASVLLGTASLASAAALATPTVVNAGSGAITVSFTSDSTAFLYTVTSTPGSLTCSVSNVTPPPSGSCTVAGLTNGTSYTFHVTPSGNGTTSTVSAESAAITPVAALAVPKVVSLGATGAGDMALVSFVSDGSATLYTVTSVNSTPVAATLTFTSATGGTYSSEVPVVGAAVTGPSATVSGGTVIATASGGIFTVSGGTATALGTATAASSVGPGCPVAGGTGTLSCKVTPLSTTGHYVFTVTPNDTTTAGVSLSYTATAVLSTPTAVAGNASAVVSFLSNGVATTYTVAATAGVHVCVVSGTPAVGSQSCTVTGLANGTAYQFTVTSSGGGDTSTVSGASTAVTPSGALAKPTVVNAGAGAQTVSFVADGVATTYTVSGGGTCVVANTTTPPTGAQSCTVSGLTSNTSYTYVVTPSGGGTSTVSASSTAVTTLTVFATPTATLNTPTTIIVNFVADGTATTYLVKSYSGATFATAGPTCTAVFGVAPANSTAETCLVTGLTAGTAYQFTVTPSGGGDTEATSLHSATYTPANSTALATPTAVTAGSGRITVSFVADGVATGYLVQGTPSGTCQVSNTTTAPTGAQSCTISGLTNGTSYTFTVVPNLGSSTSTISASSTAVVASSSLATPTTGNAGTGAIKVSFVADGTATLYTVTSSPAGGSCFIINTTTPPTGAQSCTVTGLTNGVSYTFTVTPSGNGTTSTVSAPSTALTAGTSPLATPTVAWSASGAVVVSFTPDGIASTYTVTSSPDGLTCTVVNSTTPPAGPQHCTVSGLTNGTLYTFTVTPTGNGTASLVSLASAPFLVTALSTPSVPTAVTGVGTPTTIAISWTAPASTGGSAITGYVVTGTEGNVTVSCGTVAGTVTTCTLTGLIPSTTYALSVTAVNAQGQSPVATGSAATTAAPVPFRLIRVNGYAVAGTTRTLTIIGTGFHGQPSVRSDVAGTRVGVKHDTGSALVIIVTVRAGSPRGTHHFTVTQGSVSRRVGYIQR